MGKSLCFLIETSLEVELGMQEKKMQRRMSSQVAVGDHGEGFRQAQNEMGMSVRWGWSVLGGEIPGDK